MYETQPDLESSDTSLQSESIEQPLCSYLEQFDGTIKDFTTIRSHFDDLFSDDLIYCVDGRPIDRQTFINMNQYLLEHRIIATLEDIYFSDDTHVEYTVHWGNDDISAVTHVFGVIDDDGKIIKLQPCPETSGVFANMLGPNWRTTLALQSKSLALQVDKKILGMRQWALMQRNARAAWIPRKTSGPVEV